MSTTTLTSEQQEILSKHYPAYIVPAVDAKIRERFPIRLDPADMRPGNGRWEGGSSTRASLRIQASLRSANARCWS